MIGAGRNFQLGFQAGGWDISGGVGMRGVLIGAATMVLLIGCSRQPVGETRAAATAAAAPTAASTPVRKAGLWVQTMTRDGRTSPMGRMRICIDPATDARLSVFGEKAGKAMCRRQME